MSKLLPVDLAQVTEWCGCRPGQTRAQVLATFASAGTEAKAYGSDQLTVTEEDVEWEFYFSTDGSDRLQQIAVDGTSLLWAGRPLSGAGFTDLLHTVAIPRDAFWTKTDAAADPYDELTGKDPQIVPDEALLSEGTLWLPERGLGLVIWNGSLMDVVWRDVQNLPTASAGPVTEAQIELASRPDFEDILLARAQQQVILKRPQDPARFLRGLLTTVAIMALALTVLDGFQERTLWSKALLVPATLEKVERGPLKQFLEYLPTSITQVLPPWLLSGEGWRTLPQTNIYVMSFADSQGNIRKVRLEAAEFYVPPREIGEEADLNVIAGDPPRVKGPARVNDAAFMEHVPWVIAIGFVWLLGQGLLSAIVFLWRQMKPNQDLAHRTIETRTQQERDRADLG